METIRNYLETMFLKLPNTPEVYKAKNELWQMMEDKYTELKEEGKSENEAVGIVISEFGNLDELANDLGISQFVESQPMPQGKTLSLDQAKSYLADAAGSAYPDCSSAFNNAINEAIYLGSGKQIKIVAPFIASTKDQVVKEGLKLNVPYKYTWSCYEGGEKPCGKCGTCIDRARAFELNGIKDPAMEV